MKWWQRYLYAMSPMRWLLVKAKVGGRISLGFGSLIIANSGSVQGHLRVGTNTLIECDELLVYGNATVGSGCIIRTGRLELHDGVIIENRVHVSCMKSKESVLVVGDHSIIMTECWLDTTRKIAIGRNVGIGGRSMLFTHGSWQSYLDGYPIAFGQVQIGDNAWLPWHVMILPNVNIGEDAIVAAGAVVTKSVPSGMLAAGVPAEVKRLSKTSLIDAERLGRIREIVEEFTVETGLSSIRVEDDGNVIVTECSGETSRFILMRGSPEMQGQGKSNSLAFKEFLGRYGVRL